MNQPKLTLLSHHLCPYVQRAAIALQEKDVPFERRNIDLSNKPDWFLKLSPLGEVPILLVNEETILFESSVIAEYIDEITGGGLLANDSLEKARQRAWIEFSSSVIANIGQLYSAADDDAFRNATDSLSAKWRTLAANLGNGPWFDGDTFSLVDAAFAPVFRYFEVFEQLGDTDFFPAVRKVSLWRTALANRPSVQSAVGSDYHSQLSSFLAAKNSIIGRLAMHKLTTTQEKAA